MDILREGLDREDRSRELARELEAAVEDARADARQDPFGNPILFVSLWLTRRIDRGDIAEADIGDLVRRLGRAALDERAGRLKRYVGLDARPDAALTALAGRVVDAAGDGPDGFERFRRDVERVRFGAIFTAHPTFGMRRAVAHGLAEAASGRPTTEPAGPESFRPDPKITLQDEFEQARFAVRHARDAIDALNGALLAAARTRWPDSWTTLAPRPVTLGSWVGCDTDGRTDIGWWDTLRYRLESKRSQFTRLLAKVPEHAATAEVRGLVGAALDAVESQLAKAPALNSQPSLAELQDFALILVGRRDVALPHVRPLLEALDRAIAAADDDAIRLPLCLARAGCVAHGVSIALPHFRLNASQLHNAMRRIIVLDGEPTEPAQRRAYLGAVNAALDKIEPVPVDFGALAAERASAARMLMTVAQIVKHLDGSRPVRFLVAETETGYTLLSALWLACRFGIADLVEISPLFETSDALEQGPRIIDEALRSPHWRAYLRRHGRLCIQFGYSDSGRYVGQIAASFWVERLRLRLSELLARHGLGEIALVIFDTQENRAGGAPIRTASSTASPIWRRRGRDRLSRRPASRSSRRRASRAATAISCSARRNSLARRWRGSPSLPSTWTIAGRTTPSTRSRISRPSSSRPSGSR